MLVQLCMMLVTEWEALVIGDLLSLGSLALELLVMWNDLDVWRMALAAGGTALEGRDPLPVERINWGQLLRLSFEHDKLQVLLSYGDKI